ncbi:MAG TPA: ABC transporter permease, partial [Terriglobia bacterium]|nr:ABC transporter permease [Terriglobia bacterium]
MSRVRVAVARCRALAGRKRLETNLDEELRAHLELLRDEYLGRGLSPEEARFAALRAFGGVEQVKEEYREQRGLSIMEKLAQDVRYGLRQLRRNPGFALVAVLTLALGIGANTAIFSVVNAVLLRPLPYPQSDRLVWIAEVLPALKAELAGGADYFDWRDQNQTLDRITAYDPVASFNMTGRGTPARVHAAQVSANFFATLGVGPRLGRGFTPEEDQPNGRNAAILMHSFWQQYFGSDANVLGRAVTLNGAPYAVVGVMPASFRFPGEAEVQMLVPLQMNEAQERLRVQNKLVRIIGRLKPGVTLARAENDLDAIRKRAQPPAVEAGGPGQMSGPGPGPGSLPSAGPGGGSMMRVVTSGNPPPPEEGKRVVRAPAGGGGAKVRRAEGGPPAEDQIVRRVPGAASPAGAQRGSPGPPSPAGGTRRTIRLNGPTDTQLKVVTLEEHLAGNLRPAMLTLLGVVGLVLLIACANVANLMLTRASARTREVAVRAVLGAGRWRLMRQLLSESLILALAGGLAGLVLAAWGVRVMTRLIPASVGGAILSVVPVRLDGSVLLFTLAASIVTGILFGLAPALAATRVDLWDRLKEGAQGSGAGPRRGWLRGALAVAELSLALVLLIGAGLLIKSFYRVLSVDPGFAPERVLTMNFSLTDSRYPEPGQKRAFFSEVLRRVESLPGVRSAAIGDSLPLSPYHARLMIRREVAGEGGAMSGSTLLFSRLTVSPAYFYTLGIPLLKGRTFTDGDNEQAPQVAVVNDALARHMWPGENPIGKELPLLGQGITVVGVVGNTRHEGLSSDVDSEVYVPYLQQG